MKKTISLLTVLLAVLMLSIGSFAIVYVRRVKAEQNRRNDRLYAIETAGTMLAEIRSRLREQPALAAAGTEDIVRPVDDVRSRSRYLGVWSRRPLEQQIPVQDNARPGHTSRVTMYPSPPNFQVIVEVGWSEGSVSLERTMKTPAFGSWFDESENEVPP